MENGWQGAPPTTSNGSPASSPASRRRSAPPSSVTSAHSTTPPRNREFVSIVRHETSSLSTESRTSQPALVAPRLRPPAPAKRSITGKPEATRALTLGVGVDRNSGLGQFSSGWPARHRPDPGQFLPSLVKDEELPRWIKALGTRTVGCRDRPRHEAMPNHILLQARRRRHPQLKPGSRRANVIGVDQTRNAPIRLELASFGLKGRCSLAWEASLGRRCDSDETRICARRQVLARLEVDPGECPPRVDRRRAPRPRQHLQQPPWARHLAAPTRANGSSDPWRGMYRSMSSLRFPCHRVAIGIRRRGGRSRWKVLSASIEPCQLC